MSKRNIRKADKPLRVGSDLRVRVYPVLESAVESGVAYGWHRGWKYRDKLPGLTDEIAADVCAQITSAVLTELCEAMVWDDGEGA